MLSFLLFGLLAYTSKAEDCRGVSMSGVQIAPLGVCEQIKTESITVSTRLECNDDDTDAQRAIYVTDDCSLVSTTQALDSTDNGIDLVVYDEVECDSTLNRCPYALVRIYTNLDCESGSWYKETSFIMGVCEAVGDTSSQKNVCTDSKVTSETYSGSTTCEGDVEESTLYESGVCTSGVYAEITDCKMDKAIVPHIVVSVILSFIITFV